MVDHGGLVGGLMRRVSDAGSSIACPLIGPRCLLYSTFGRWNFVENKRKGYQRCFVYSSLSLDLESKMIVYCFDLCGD